MKKLLLSKAKLTSAWKPVTEQGAGIFKDKNIDRTGFLSGIFGIEVGAVSGTPTSFSVAAKIQHSDTTTDEDYVDVPGYTLPTLTAINTETSKGFDLTGLKKYVRIVATIAFVGGSTPKVFLTGPVVLGDAIAEPVS
jgi:hypothetical protein